MKRRGRVARSLARLVFGPGAPQPGADGPRLESIDDWILFGPRMR